MITSADINYGWFPVRITAKTGSGASARYSWVRRWVEPAGTVGNMPGVASGDSGGDLAGVNLTGDDLSVGDDALARPAPGAGGTLYELMPSSVAASPPPPSPPAPPPPPAAAGWGWLAGLDPVHCIEANITPGFGRSNCIPSQIVYLEWDSGAGAFVSTSNASFCCGGNGVLILAVTNGNPVLSIGNATLGCGNLTLSGYHFSYDGAQVASYAGFPTDTVYFRGGGEHLANGPFNGGAFGNVTIGNTSYYNTKPTGSNHTFGVTVRLVECVAPTCCTEPPQELFLGLSNYADGGGGTYNGTIPLRYGNLTNVYANGTKSPHTGQGGTAGAQDPSSKGHYYAWYGVLDSGTKSRVIVFDICNRIVYFLYGDNAMTASTAQAYLDLRSYPAFSAFGQATVGLDSLTFTCEPVFGDRDAGNVATQKGYYLVTE